MIFYTCPKEENKMTRGQIAIITKANEIYTSIEFNGDMYLEGWGNDAIEELKSVHTPDEYYKAVDKFNKEHHNYDEPHLTFRINGEPAKQMLNFATDYFDNWFSDYVYIKNISDDTIQIIQRKKSRATIINLRPGEIAVLNFGECVKRTK